MTTRRKCYSSDLSDAEWSTLEPIVPKARSNLATGGAPERYPKREIVNGILYVKTNGCKWQDLPGDLPPTGIVFHYFTTWSKDGTWRRLNGTLRERVRMRAGKKPEPTAGIIDAQSAKNSDIPVYSGYDAGKKVKGIKRHIVTDTLGLLLLVHVHTADIQDRDGARWVIAQLRRSCETVQTIFADQGYAGKLIGWVALHCNALLEIVRRVGLGFQILPKRWIVERTFAWLGKARRLDKNYERSPRNAEAFVYVTMIHLMVKRLAA